MPTAPSASEEQKQVLSTLIDLSQTASLDAQNQIAIVDNQLQKLDKASALFQDRYNYWHTYVSKYEEEKKYLNGIYLLSPLPLVDRNTYPSSGNDFSDFVYTSGTRLDGGQEAPKRIDEFDGNGSSDVSVQRETLVLSTETMLRTLLLSGFSEGTISGNIHTTTAITPSTTSLVFESTSGTGDVTPGGRVVIYSGNDACVAKVLTAVYHAPGIPGHPATWDVTLEYQTDFTSVASNATVTSNVSGFTNTERTTLVASLSYRQGLLNALTDNYRSTILSWSDRLVAQYVEINTVTEDQPDNDYIASQMNSQSIMTGYMANPKYDDTTLSYMQARNVIRTSEIPARVSWINNRLVSSGSYDQRYNYANLLFNRSMGSYNQQKRFQSQKTMLQAQQPVLAARAAAYQAEKF